MNRVRIIGFILLIIGLILPFTLQNDIIDFLTGLLIGIGIGFLITGKIRRTDQNPKHVSET